MYIPLEIEASSLDNALALAYTKLAGEGREKKLFRVAFRSVQFRTNCITSFVYILDAYLIEEE